MHAVETGIETNRQSTNRQSGIFIEHRKSTINPRRFVNMEIRNHRLLEEYKQNARLEQM